MQIIILSICIPTYNRANNLREAIESIFSNISIENENKIEICISDNCSTDDTSKVLRDLQSKSKVKFVFSQNKTNLGADLNYLNVVNLANGIYCWFLGSDDLMNGNKINTLIDILENGKYDILVSDREEYNYNFTMRIGKSNNFKKDNLEFNNSYMYFRNVNRLLGLFSFISSIVFKRDLWDKQNNKEKYVGTLYSHVYILMKMLKDNKTIKIMNFPICKWRWNFIDKNRFEVVLGNYNRIYIDFYYFVITADVFGLDSLEFKEIFRIINNEIPITRLLRIKNILLFKNEYAEYLKLLQLLRNFGYIYKFILCIATPNFLLNFIKQLRALLKMGR